MNKSKKITDGAFLTAMYIALLLLVIFIPFIQLFGIFILPIPFIMYASRHGYKAGIIMALVSILLSLIFATAISLPFTLLVSIGGIVVGNGMYQKRNPYEIWALGTVGFSISFVLVLAMVQFIFAFNIFTELEVLINESIEMTRSLMANVPLGSANLEEQLQFMEEQMKELINLIPASIAIVSMFFAFIGQWFTYKIVNRVENKQLKFPPFKDLNFPVIVIWIYFIVLLLSFIKMDSDGMFYMVLINISALTTTFLVIQGFSFIFFFMDHKKIHISVPIIIVIVSLLIPFLFMFIVRIIGIIDLGFSLKKQMKEQKMRK